MDIEKIQITSKIPQSTDHKISPVSKEKAAEHLMKTCKAGKVDSLQEKGVYITTKPDPFKTFFRVNQIPQKPQNNEQKKATNSIAAKFKPEKQITLDQYKSDQKSENISKIPNSVSSEKMPENEQKIESDKKSENSKSSIKSKKSIKKEQREDQKIEEHKLPIENEEKSIKIIEEKIPNIPESEKLKNAQNISEKQEIIIIDDSKKSNSPLKPKLQENNSNLIESKENTGSLKRKLLTGSNEKKPSSSKKFKSETPPIESKKLEKNSEISLNSISENEIQEIILKLKQDILSSQKNLCSSLQLMEKIQNSKFNIVAKIPEKAQCLDVNFNFYEILENLLIPPIKKIEISESQKITENAISYNILMESNEISKFFL